MRGAWKMTSNSSANVPQTNDASKICEGVNPLLMQEMESEEKKEIQKQVYYVKEMHFLLSLC